MGNPTSCINCGYAAKRKNPDCGDHPTPESAEGKPCPKCTYPNKDNQRFCVNCGAELPTEMRGLLLTRHSALRRAQMLGSGTDEPCP